MRRNSILQCDTNRHAISGRWVADGLDEMNEISHNCNFFSTFRSYCRMLRTLKIVALLLLLATTAFSQRSQLLDAVTREPVPFSKVIPTPGTPFLADIDGYFTVPEGAERLLFRSQGYYDSLYPVTALGKTVLLRPMASELEEVVIVPGINPAERIMELAIANRKRNHPKSDQSFSYTSYGKFVFTLNPDALAQISDTTSDSNLIDMRKYFSAQHLFMLESTTEKYFEPQNHEKEIITAYRVSGFTDPAFSTFVNDLQTFNFYENQFTLLGATYVNPLAAGSIRRYLFILEDETVSDGDTTFTIRFQPRISKNFDAMKGWLYINSNGYAVEKVIAEPARPSKTFSPKIIQEYAYVDGKKWFPVKLSTEVTFPGVLLDNKIKDAYLIGKGSTYIENITIGEEISRKRFNAVLVETDRNAAKQDSAHWNSKRTYELTEKEQRTYAFVDSISAVHKLNQRFSSLSALAEGKIPVGYVQFDLLRLLDYNDYEGYRIGLGMENSRKLMERLTVGGYFGYGTRDKRWKYGGYARWMVLPKYFVELQGTFQQDVVERGGYHFLSTEHSLAAGVNTLYRQLYVLNMENQRKAEVALSGYLTPRIKLLGSVNYQRIGLTKEYVFSKNGLVLNGARTFDQAEANAEVVWTIGEKVMYLGTKRVSKGSAYPQIMAKATRGYSGIEKSQFDYARLNIDIRHDIPVRAVGKFSYLISGAKTWGAVPLYLQQVSVGTGGNWNLSVTNTFETMQASSFFHSEQLALFTRFMFKPFKTNKKWTTPQIGLHHAMGIGTFKGRQYHNTDFLSMDKGYYEAGLLLDKLINLNTMGFGVGIFYNYGPYGVPDAAENLTLKLSFSYVIN